MNEDSALANLVAVLLRNDLQSLPTTDQAVQLHLRLRAQPIAEFGESAFQRRERLKRCWKLPVAAALAAPRAASLGRFFTELPEPVAQFRERYTHAAPPRAETESQRAEAAALRSWFSGAPRPRPQAQLVDVIKLSERKVRAFALCGDGLLACDTARSVRWRPPGGAVVELCRSAALANHVTVAALGAGLHRAHAALFNGEILSTALPESPAGVVAHAVFRGHAARVNMTDLHCSQLALVSCSHDCSLRFWDYETQTQLLLQEGHGSAVHCCRFNPLEPNLLASSDLDGYVKLWDVRANLNVLNLDAHEQMALALAWHPQVPWLLCSAGAAGVARLWDLRAFAGTAPRHYGEGRAEPRATAVRELYNHSGVLRNVAFEPGAGRYLASFGCDGKLCLANMQNEEVTQLMQTEPDLPNAFALAVDGHIFCSFQLGLINRLLVTH